jgi:4-hydroxybenzoate polyprenyltransferase
VIGAVLRSMRPRQWSKNVFVLAPLIFARLFHDPIAIARAAAAFGSFCLMASGVYLVNDSLDYEEDRKHPQKKHRPIAAGELSRSTAVTVAVVLFIASIATAYAINLRFLTALIVYLVMNLSYSSGLKTVVILDVMMVAAGFVIRAIAGAVALDVPMSDWLFLCTTMVALFLAFTKRRQELVHLGDDAHKHRKSLSHYNVAFLDQMISITTSSTVLTYALYTLSPEVTRKFHTDNLKWTVPFVLFGIFRYLYLVHVRHVPGDPTSTLLGDLPSVLNVCAWGLVVLYVLM